MLGWECFGGLDIPIPCPGSYSGASHHDIAKRYQIVCRLHELVR